MTSFTLAFLFTLDCEIVYISPRQIHRTPAMKWIKASSFLLCLFGDTCLSSGVGLRVYENFRENSRETREITAIFREIKYETREKKRSQALPHLNFPQVVCIRFCLHSQPFYFPHYATKEYSLVITSILHTMTL
jgi:hypothetical protein